LAAGCARQSLHKENIMKVHSYLILNGNCAEAFAFYEKVLGGKIMAMIRFGDMPAPTNEPSEGCAGGKVDPNAVAHVCLSLGDSLLMGSDTMPAMPEKIGGFNVNLEIAETARAESTFAALSAGGNVRMPLQETFWAKRFGMFTDKFGTPWMINCPKENAGPAKA
jgi:PhnB protein